MIKAKCSESFSDGGAEVVSSVTISFRDSSASLSSVQLNAFASVADTNGIFTPATCNSNLIPSQSTGSPLYGRLIVDGGSGQAINDLTQGIVDGWVLCFVGL